MKTWKKLYVIGLVITISFTLFTGMVPPTPQTVTRVANLAGIPNDYQKFSYSGGEVVPMRETRGSNYLYEDWAKASLILAGDSIEVEEVEVRVDLMNLVIEIKDEEGKTKVFPSFLINSARFHTTGEVVAPMQAIGEDGPPGFYGVLYEEGDDLGFYCHLSTYLKEANYNPALDAGRTYDEIVLNKNYYVRIKGELVKLDNRKSKRMAQLVTDKEVMKFVDEQNIDIRSEEGVIALLKYIGANKKSASVNN